MLEPALPSIHKDIPAELSIPEVRWSRLIGQGIPLELLLVGSRYIDASARQLIVHTQRRIVLVSTKKGSLARKRGSRLARLTELRDVLIPRGSRAHKQWAHSLVLSSGKLARCWGSSGSAAEPLLSCLPVAGGSSSARSSASNELHTWSVPLCDAIGQTQTLTSSRLRQACRSGDLGPLSREGRRAPRCEGSLSVVSGRAADKFCNKRRGGQRCLL